MWVLFLLMEDLLSNNIPLHNTVLAYLKGPDCPIRQSQLHKQKWLQNTAQGTVGKGEEAYRRKVE